MYIKGILFYCCTGLTEPGLLNPGMNQMVTPNNVNYLLSYCSQVVDINNNLIASSSMVWLLKANVLKGFLLF